jgi:hypothetical protein
MEGSSAHEQIDAVAGKTELYAPVPKSKPPKVKDKAQRVSGTDDAHTKPPEPLAPTSEFVPKITCCVWPLLFLCPPVGAQVGALWPQRSHQGPRKRDEGPNGRQKAPLRAPWVCLRPRFVTSAVHPMKKWLANPPTR